MLSFYTTTESLDDNDWLILSKLLQIICTNFHQFLLSDIQQCLSHIHDIATPKQLKTNKIIGLIQSLLDRYQSPHKFKLFNNRIDMLDTLPTNAIVDLLLKFHELEIYIFN